MSDNTLRRRAAWAALQDHLDDDSCIDALWLLENHYQKSDTYSLIEYIDKVVERYHLSPSLKQELYFSYFNHLKKPNTIINDDPLPWMKNRQPTEPCVAAAPQRQRKPAPKAVNEKMVIFDFMITKMLKEVNDNSNQLFADVMANCAHHNLPVSVIQELHHWISSPDTYLWRNELDTSDLATIVHIFYIALCNLLGPVAADRLWHQVLAEVERIPEAKVFSVRALF